MGKAAGVRIVCKEDCGSSPKKLFLRDFNIAAAKVNLPFIKKSLTEDVMWHLFEPAGQKEIFGRDNVLQEYKNNLVIVPIEFVIDTIITHGYGGAVKGQIKSKDGKLYVFGDFYEFNSAKSVKIKSMTSYIVEIKN
ncbi:MAG: nuclear transport factor 2 family protein [Bacteroidota bacterium]